MTPARQRGANLRFDKRPLWEALMAVDSPAPATREIVEANTAVRMRLPFSDTEDFDDARRGLIGSLGSSGLVNT